MVIRDRVKQREANKKSYQKHKDKRIAYYQEHKEAVAERMKVYWRKHWRKLKTEVLTHYGGGTLACVICGEEHLACLSIDHINGNGAEERRRLKIRAQPLYRWLKQQGYPEGYQTLCMNCQFIKKEINNECRRA